MSALSDGLGPNDKLIVIGAAPDLFEVLPIQLINGRGSRGLEITALVRVGWWRQNLSAPSHVKTRPGKFNEALWQLREWQ